MAITVNHSVTATLSPGVATLGDLKQLVAAAERAGLDDGARLSVDKTLGDQREQGYITMTVRQR